MKIIAFDLGAHFACAANASNGTRLFTYHKEMKGIRAHRLGEFSNALQHLLLGHYDIVVYETPFARGRDATRSLWGMAGVLEAAATDYNLPVVDVAVPTIKKFATGHGFAPKMAMIKAAHEFGYRGDNEHIADAVCLLRYAEENLERIHGRKV